MARSPTGDFDHYDDPAPLSAAVCESSWVTVEWVDAVSARFHHVWLRDNCACEECVHPGTREQVYELPAVGPMPTAVDASVIDGVLVIGWIDGHRSSYDSGWLRAHSYDIPRPPRRARAGWDASEGRPWSASGPDVLADDDALLAWLRVLDARGVALLHDLPSEHDTVLRVVERIGVVRDTNFGRDWDVVVETDPESNAYTALELPPHTDLPTREYQPGLQFLHCLVNDAEGGDSILVDGFRVAEILRDSHPEHYEVLTTMPWDWANRSRTTDHRWSRPPIMIDEAGDPIEVRFGNWLRAPLTSVPFDRVLPAYEAYRCMSAVARDSSIQVRFRFEAGDLVAFDNRRVMHGRGRFDSVGRRHLRGAYSEREELTSRIRVLERARRAARHG